MTTRYIVGDVFDVLATLPDDSVDLVFTSPPFPPALVVKPLLAMCPAKVCRTCGEPSRRIVEAMNALGSRGINRRPGTPEVSGIGAIHHDPQRTTLGWTDCGHDDYRPGLVLDPFAGSGTVLAVASGHGRDSIGIDIDSRNAELARQRVGMFLDVVTPELDGAA